jgi:chaperonin cofactor prefoldin
MCYQKDFDQVRSELISIKGVASLVRIKCALEEFEEEVLSMQHRIDDLKRQNNTKRRKCCRLQEKINAISKPTQTPE